MIHRRAKGIPFETGTGLYEFFIHPNLPSFKSLSDALRLSNVSQSTKSYPTERRFLEGIFYRFLSVMCRFLVQDNSRAPECITIHAFKNHLSVSERFSGGKTCSFVDGGTETR